MGRATTTSGGLNMLRRREMMKLQGGGHPYIADGLVFWLDGIDKGADDGRWVDLVGGVVWSNNGAVETDNGFYYDGTTWHSATECPTFNQNECTIEVCVDVQSLGSYPYLFSDGDTSIKRGIFFGNRLGYVVFQKNNTAIQKKAYPTLLNGKVTISANAERCVKNCTNIQGTTQIYNIQITDKRIARMRTTSTGLNGTLHSIRIYNRLLTTEEMLNNQRVDNERYGLGL